MRHRTLRIITTLALGIVGIICLGVIGYSVVLLAGDFWQTIAVGRYYGDYEARSSPLEPQTVADLCAKLDLPARDWRCQPGAEVYAPHFFPQIELLARTARTYDDIEALFGPYKDYCSEVFGDPLDPNSYFACDYDLQGDGVYLFECTFGADGRLERITARAIPEGGL